MIKITFGELFLFITALWVIVRAVVNLKNKSFSFKREAQLLLVYVCLIVISRMVYFPFKLDDDGYIRPMVFNASKAFPPRVNFIPIVALFEKYDGWLINIIGNVLMFVPVGIVWPVCFKKLDTVGKTVLAGFGYTLLIEISQLPFYDRCTDVDDLILNTLGAFIGALICFGCRKLKKRASAHP